MSRVDWKARAIAAEREVARLKKIEHAAWHALDDGCEVDRDDEHGAHVRISWADFMALHKLLPEDHPEPARPPRRVRCGTGSRPPICAGSAVYGPKGCTCP